MDDIDDFVLLYLRHDFDASSALAPRNLDAENYLIRKSKLELKLASSLYDIDALSKWIPTGREGEIGGRNYSIKDWKYIEISGNRIRPNADANGVSFPLIEFYAAIHELTSDSAMTELLKHFDVSDDFGSDINPEGGNIQRIRKENSYLRKAEYPFFDYDGSIIGRLGVIQTAADKRLLPVSLFSVEKSLCWLYIPFDQQIIYNFDFLRENRKSPIILTDSVLTAYSNQTKARLSRKEIDFISWMGGMNTIRKLDLKQFRDCKLYYLIFNHSGLTGWETYQNALKVVNEFESKDVKLNLVSFLTDVMPEIPKNGYFLGFPRIVEKEALSNQMDKPAVCISQPQSLKLFAEKSNSTALLTPIIMPRTITLFLGAPLSGKTVLTTAMSWAISQGSGLFKQWRAPAPRSVLYILGEQPERSLWQIMSVHFKTHVKGNKEILEKHIHPGQSSRIPQGVLSLFGDLQAQPYPAMPKGLTVDSPIGKKIRYGQFWGISADRQDSMFKIADWITYTNRQLNLLRQRGVSISLIVLDHLLAFQSLFCNPSEVNSLNDWLMTMQFEGYAIWIIPPGRVDDRSTNHMQNSLRINNCIHVNKIKSVNPSDVTMSIEIEQTCKSLEKQGKKFSVTINPSASCPVWHSVETGLTRSKKKSIVNKLLAKGKNGPQIALETGFSLSSVKDLKRALKLSKKTPSKAPHKKPKDLQYHYTP